jgi:predicted TIM-barrel fold metal-dependent hydrolase
MGIAADERALSDEIVAATPIIDVDSHVSEPGDLWTSRMSVAKWGSLVPHVRRDESTGEDFWYVGDKRLMGVGAAAIAGWHDFFPSHPPTLAEADPGAFDPTARLQRMDEYGLQAQLLYPNVLGTFSGLFLGLEDPQLSLECVRAYNDFLSDFCSVDPDRLVPLTVVPFWDLEASRREIERCGEMGHRGVVMAAHHTAVGFPELADPYWTPLLDVAQSLGQSINFHIGFSQLTENDLEKAVGSAFDARTFARDSVLMFVGNISTITEIVLSGLCDRFPRLPFVSVESGAGYLPFLLEAMDWQWRNSGCATKFAGASLPSEIFRRQIYGTWWFEARSRDAVRDLADNIMFETDYPHPTSLSPGPASFAEVPRESARRSLSGMPDDVIRKVLHDTAARLYRLP